MYRAYKTELKPNNRQKTYFAQCAGTARFVFNWGLATWGQWYEDGLKPSKYALKKHFNSIKDEQCPWVRQYPYTVTEAAFQNLGNAFSNFFRRVKRGETPGYPKFKRRGKKDSFCLTSTKIGIDRVRLTNLGWVRIKERGYIPVNAKYGLYATISRMADRWYISILVETKDQEAETHNVIGVDFGLKTLAVCSDGKMFDNPKAHREALAQVARLNRELSRRKQGGANWKKTKRKLQRAYAKVARIRKHLLHDISHYLTHTKKPRMIVLEDLNVSGMIANRHLAFAVSDVGFYELRRQIEYKASQLGIEVLIADRWFPSTQTCSRCGHRKEGDAKLGLDNRVYVCDECGLEIDRDFNAALNLKRLGVNQLAA